MMPRTGLLSDLEMLRSAPADAGVVEALDGLEKRVNEAKKLVQETESKVEELGNSIKRIEESQAEKRK